MENLSFPNIELRVEIAKVNEKAIVLDGLDEAIVGTVEMFGKEAVVCYDKDMVLDIIMDNTGGDRQEADGTPVFLSRMGVIDPTAKAGGLSLTRRLQQ